MDGIKTGVESLLRDKPGGCLLTGEAVPGVKVARAWSGLWCGTREPVAPMGSPASGVIVPWAGCLEREPQAAGTARGRVAMRGTGADRPVVAMKAL
jgi:hypothetical protein